MLKNKKILLISSVIIGLLILSITGYYFYSKFIIDRDYQIAVQKVEEQGLNNISGTVKSIEGNNLRVLAQVPEDFTPFSKGGYKYINKEFLLKTSSETQILFYVENNNFNQLSNLDTIKIDDKFSAVSKTNILNNNELEVVELMFYR
jgi:hypothetical protein